MLNKLSHAIKGLYQTESEYLNGNILILFYQTFFVPRFMLGLAGLPAVLQFLGFIFMPESPRWLIVSKQEEKARRVLQSLRGQLDIEEEYDSIRASCVESQQDEHIACKNLDILQYITAVSGTGIVVLEDVHKTTIFEISKNQWCVDKYMYSYQKKD